MYNATAWKDHVTEFPRRRKIIDNGDGTITLQKDQGRILRQGTPQSATNFNNMESGVFDAYLAVGILLNQMRQQGWKADRIAEALTALAASGIGTARYQVTIPAAGWEADDSGGVYPLRLDLPNAEISPEHTPILAIAPESMRTAVACGLACAARTLRGALRVFALSVPERPITSVLTLIGTAPDIAPVSGGGNGGASTSTDAKTAASDSDVGEMFRDVFG